MIGRISIIAVFSCALFGIASLYAQQARSRDLRLSKATRRALVIGNDDYVKAPRFRKAVNDAKDLASDAAL